MYMKMLHGKVRQKIEQNGKNIVGHLKNHENK